MAELSKMQPFTIDDDEDSCEFRELTKEEIDFYKVREKSAERKKIREEDQEEEDSSKEQSETPPQKKIKKGKIKKQKLTSKDKKQRSKEKFTSRTVITKNKREEISSDEESSSTQNRQKQPIKERKTKEKSNKDNPAIQLSPASRYFRQTKQSDLFKYGNAKFVKTTKKSPLALSSKKAKETIRTGVTWWIQRGQYTEHGWSKIFADMNWTDIRDLRLPNNRYQNIVMDIYHVRFECLEILNLSQNNIKSIEMLSRSKMPLLKDLSLKENQLTTLSPICRMALQNLQALNIADNPILQLDRFFNINSLSLNQLFIEWTSSNVICQDLSWIAKIKKNGNKVTYMQKICVQSKNRILQRNVDFIIAEKYNKKAHFIIKRKLT